MSYKPANKKEEAVMKLLLAFEPNYIKLDKLLCLFASSKNLKKDVVLNIFGSGANGKSIFLKLMDMVFEIDRVFIHTCARLRTYTSHILLYPDLTAVELRELQLVKDADKKYLHVITSNRTPLKFNSEQVNHQCSTVFNTTQEESQRIINIIKEPETKDVMKKIFNYYSQMNMDVLF